MHVNAAGHARTHRRTLKLAHTHTHSGALKLVADLEPR